MERNGKIDPAEASPDATQETARHMVVPDPAGLLKAKIQIAVNRLMATYLTNLEEVADEHDEAMGRLIDTLPDASKASVYLADHFTDVRFEAIRRHVLRAGNDQYRELCELIDFLRIQSN